LAQLDEVPRTKQGEKLWTSYLALSKSPLGIRLVNS